MHAQRSIKHYLILCLVALQLLAPFLHAHLWGDGMVKKAQGFHLHLDSYEQVDSVFKQPTLQSIQSNSSSVGVSTGIAAKSPFDQAALLQLLELFCLLALVFVFNKFFLLSQISTLANLLPPARASPI